MVQETNCVRFGDGSNVPGIPRPNEEANFDSVLLPNTHHVHQLPFRHHVNSAALRDSVDWDVVLLALFQHSFERLWPF